MNCISEETFKSEISQMSELIFKSYESGSYNGRMEFDAANDEAQIKDRIFKAVCAATLIKVNIMDEIETKGEDASFTQILLSIPFSRYDTHTALGIYYKDILLSMARAYEIIEKKMPDILLSNEILILSERIFVHGLVYSVNADEVVAYAELLNIEKPGVPFIVRFFERMK